jgi:hypothetical protein
MHNVHRYTVASGDAAAQLAIARVLLEVRPCKFN